MDKLEDDEPTGPIYRDEGHLDTKALLFQGFQSAGLYCSPDMKHKYFKNAHIYKGVPIRVNAALPPGTILLSVKKEVEDDRKRTTVKALPTKSIPEIPESTTVQIEEVSEKIPREIPEQGSSSCNRKSRIFEVKRFFIDRSRKRRAQ